MTETAEVLRDLPLADLQRLWTDGDGELCDAILRECRRRDVADRARRARAAEISAWREAVQAQYLAADAECAGNLLSRDGMDAGITAETILWSGPETWARRMASEELNNYWDDHGGRLTITRWRQQMAAAARIARDDADLAAMDAAAETADDTTTTEASHDSAVEPDDASGLRPAADGARSQARAERPERVVLHRYADQDASAGPAAGAAPRASRFVRPDDRGGQLSLALSFAEVRPRRTRWLWAGFAAYGHVTLLAGEGGVGKGLSLVDIAARVTRGQPMPGESEPCEAAAVIMVTPEDSIRETVTYRLRAARADLSRVYDLTETPDGVPFTLPDHVELLRRVIAETGARVVVIDPMMATVGRPVTSNLGARAVLGPLLRLAEETGVAILLSHHLVKSGAVAGSKAVTDTCRLVLRAERDRGEVRVTVEKANITSGAAEIRYRVAGEGPAAHVEWITAAEVRSRRTGTMPGQGAPSGRAAPTAADARAAGCKPGHAGTRWNTPAMCGDCPARGLCKRPGAPVRPAAAPQARTAPVTRPAAPAARVSRPAPAYTPPQTRVTVGGSCIVSYGSRP